MTNEGESEKDFKSLSKEERDKIIRKEYREAVKKRLTSEPQVDNQPSPTSEFAAKDSEKGPKLTDHERHEKLKKEFIKAYNESSPTQQEEVSQQPSPTDQLAIIGESGKDSIPAEDLIKLKPKDIALLEKATEEYKNSPRTPESETKYWQARWKAYGLEIEVQSCDRTMKELKKLKRKGRKLIYVPKELAAPEGLILLGKMHPMMGWNAEKGKNIINESSTFGWIDVESTRHAPKTGSTEAELRERYKKQGRIGMNLPVYIIASQDSKDRYGKYFDEKIWTQLPGSSIGGRILVAGFGEGGFLHAYPLPPETKKDRFLGGRSMRIKDAY